MSALDSKLEQCQSDGTTVARCRWDDIKHWCPELVETTPFAVVQYCTGPYRYTWRKIGPGRWNVKDAVYELVNCEEQA